MVCWIPNNKKRSSPDTSKIWANLKKGNIKMIIFDEKEERIIKALLYYIAEETNFYWRSDSDIDHDKEEFNNYFKMRKRLEQLNMIKKDDDLSEVIYKLKDLI